MKYNFILFVIIFQAVNVFAQSNQNLKLMEQAKKIHRDIITVDTHIDINTANFTKNRNYSSNLNTQVNIPKMKIGGLDVAWFVVYTPQGALNESGYANAYKEALEKFGAINRLITEYAPGEICLATTTDEVRNLVKNGELVAMIGVENAYPLGADLSKIKKFYDLGARYMGLCHNGNNQFSDSHTGEKNGIWLNNGLSELGKKAVLEMNRLGIMVDVSHLSKEAIKQIFEISQAPVIASHSSARALSDHSRNLDDELLDLFNEHGGVVQAVAHPTFVNKQKHYAFLAAEKEIYANTAAKMDFNILSHDSISQLSTAQQNDYYTKYAEVKRKSAAKIEQLKKEKAVNVSDFVDHLDYLVKKIGINHVGISSDFDGGGGIYGWNNASENLNVTMELLKRGYSKDEIAKLWGENLLRILDEVETVARKIGENK